MQKTQRNLKTLIMGTLQLFNFSGNVDHLATKETDSQWQEYLT